MPTLYMNIDLIKQTVYAKYYLKFKYSLQAVDARIIQSKVTL